MKISFYVAIILLYMYSCSVTTVFSKSLQVGTVLFTKTDLVRKCWTQSDKSLLRARLIMQDVLPDPDCIDFSKPGVVLILLDYFHFCYEIISKSCYGKLQNFLLLGLSDALGGYLKAYALPLTKRAYYAGLVNYAEASKLFQLYEDIRIFLKTCGAGWANPQKLSPLKIVPRPLVISNFGGKIACNQLYFLEKKGKPRDATPTGSLVNPTLTKNRSLQPWSQDADKVVNCCNLTEISIEKPLKNPNCTLPLPSTSTAEPSETKRFAKSILDSESEILPTENTNKDVIDCDPLCGLEYANKSSFDFLTNQNQNPNINLNLKNPEEKKIEEGIRERMSSETGEESAESSDNSEEDEEPGKKPDKSSAKSESKTTRLIVPLPVMDDSSCPTTIAVPFKEKPIRNLRFRSSAFLLVHYYTNVIKCAAFKIGAGSEKSIKNFNSEFHNWILAKVIPHLKDQEWYPAFGGVFRIIQTMKALGSDSSFKDPAFHDLGFMFNDTVDLVDTPKGKEKTRAVDDLPVEPGKYLIISVLILSALGICTFCTIAFYCQAREERKKRTALPRYKADLPRPKKASLINFEFLVKFFKKNDDDNATDTSSRNFKKKYNESSVFWFNTQKKPGDAKNPNWERKKGERGYSDKELSKSAAYPPRKMGEGDIPTFLLTNPDLTKKPFSSMLSPVWPYQGPFLKLKKITLTSSSNVNVPRAGGEGPVQKSLKNSDVPVKTIWKKNVAQAKHSTGDEKETESSTTDKNNEASSKTTTSTSGTTTNEVSDNRKRESTTEKRSCSCHSNRESCPYSKESSTNVSSRTQESTGDSETEREGSYSSDSSTTTSH